MKITKEMFDQFIEANKGNTGKLMDYDTYKKSGLDANEYIYISDHYEELKKLFKKNT